MYPMIRIILLTRMTAWSHPPRNKELERVTWVLTATKLVVIFSFSSLVLECVQETAAQQILRSSGVAERVFCAGIGGLWLRVEVGEYTRGCK